MKKPFILIAASSALVVVSVIAVILYGLFTNPNSSDGGGSASDSTNTTTSEPTQGTDAGSSTKPDNSGSSSGSNALPSDFPDVPLLNNNIVAGSYKDVVNPNTNQKAYFVTVKGGDNDLATVVSQFQGKGWEVSSQEPPTATFFNDNYVVSVTQDGTNYQYTINPTVK